MKWTNHWDTPLNLANFANGKMDYLSPLLTSEGRHLRKKA